METNQTSFDVDFQWGQRFLDEVIQIIAPIILRPAPYEDDAFRNTDLMVLNAANESRIGVRIRRPDYWPQYADEFTIRSGRHNGTKTELRKILEGWGRYFFYGIADDAEEHLRCYFLGDLNVFRGYFVDHVVRYSGAVPGVEKSNHDGSSVFRVFKIADMPSHPERFCVLWHDVLMDLIDSL